MVPRSLGSSHKARNTLQGHRALSETATQDSNSPHGTEVSLMETSCAEVLQECQSHQVNSRCLTLHAALYEEATNGRVRSFQVYKINSIPARTNTENSKMHSSKAA